MLVQKPHNLTIGAWNLEEDRWDRYDKGSWKAPEFKQAVDHPVVCITWHDFQNFYVGFRVVVELDGEVTR